MARTMAKGGVTLLTPHQEKKKRQEAAMFAEYVTALEDPRQMKTPLREYLMGKYGIFSLTRFYRALSNAYESPDTPEELKRKYEQTLNGK